MTDSERRKRKMADRDDGGVGMDLSMASEPMDSSTEGIYEISKGLSFDNQQRATMMDPSTATPGLGHGNPRAGVPIPKVPPFLDCHLTILKSLYNNDSSIDQSVWTMVRDFLLKRPALKRVQESAQQMRIIHAEAEKVAARATANLEKKENQARSRGIAWYGYSPPSPYGYNSKLTYRPGLSRGGTGVRPMAKSSLTLVAHLLGRRAQVNAERVQQDSDSYHALLRLVDRHLDNLESDVHTLRKSLAQRQHSTMDRMLADGQLSIERSPRMDDIDILRVGQDEESKLTTLETKRHLWLRLMHSLRDTAGGSE